MVLNRLHAKFHSSDAFKLKHQAAAGRNITTQHSTKNYFGLPSAETSMKLGQKSSFFTAKLRHAIRRFGGT